MAALRARKQLDLMLLSLYRTFFKKPRHEVAIVIPMYKEMLDEKEKISFEQCLKVLGNYPIIIVAPRKVDLMNVLRVSKRIQIYRFEDTAFDSIKSYSRLLVTTSFYEKFLSYKYILIYQLDSFVFSDQLHQWCSRNYDYIGAPWIDADWLRKVRPFFWSRKNKEVGNGGFSLRNIRKFLIVLYLFYPFAAYFNRKAKKNIIHEDLFWSLYTPSFFPKFRIPDTKTALGFSFELKPSKAFEMNNNQLPFGTHAWEKHEKEFWKPFIKGQGYDV